MSDKELKQALAQQRVSDQRRRLECFLAELLYIGEVPYIKLRDAVLKAKASGFRPSPSEMDGCIAELVFWLMDYEIGKNPLPVDYEFTNRPYEDEDE